MKSWLSTLAFCASLTAGARGAEDLIVSDFESEGYGAWTATGDAFGAGPARGALPGQMAVEGFHGERLVNTFARGDDATGTLISPAFRLERKYLAFLIGGGRNEEKLALQLLVDGRVVRHATGPNDRPGGSETLAPAWWDVSEFTGRMVKLRIVDEATGGWGHLNVDDIVQTDTKPKGLAHDVERVLVASSRYLLLPIKNGAPRRVVTLLVDGQAIVRNDVELADAAPDWWAPMEVDAWKGRSLTVRVDQLREDSAALASIQESDTYPEADSLYHEALRGQFHFSPRRGWNNDPNGMVFYGGEYHLFFQHNPYGWGWGNMHWGHAVSRDMVHWEELGEALRPDELGPMFSGSAVVDWKNTSGFGREGRPPMVMFYTAAGNPTVQGLAYSTDGRTFTKFAGNPVLKEITGGNRDPKVIWHEASKQWVMALYVELNHVHTIHFFTSPNLRDWTFASKTDGFFECPDLFELPVDGDAARRKWVLTAASSEYRLGEFDGEKFVSESPKLPGQRGRGFYAAQTFSDVPDGRRIQIGWWQTETRGMPFNQSMTVPLELGLTQTDDGPRLTYTPIRELETLRGAKHEVPAGALTPGAANPLAGVGPELAEIRAEFTPGDANEIAFDVRGVPVIYDAKKQELSVAGHRTPAPLRGGRQRLTIYCDRTGLEVFASDGLCYLPLPVNLKPDQRQYAVEARGGAATLASLVLYELKSAWPR